MHVLRCCGTYLLGSECQFRFLVELTHKTQLYFQTFVMLSRYSPWKDNFILEVVQCSNVGLLYSAPKEDDGLFGQELF